MMQKLVGGAEYIADYLRAENERLRAALERCSQELDRRGDEIRRLRAVGIGSNRHPMDEIADLRAQNKKNWDREQELRPKILSGEYGLVGDDYVGIVQVRPVNRVDLQALRKYLGDDLKPFLHTKEVTQLWIKPKTQVRGPVEQSMVDEEVED
jgi:hypothetical protein